MPAFNCPGTVQTWDDLIRDGKYRLEIPDRLVIESTSHFLRAGVKRVLDLGCGLGRHMDHFSRLGYPVVGVDISPVALEHSKYVLNGRPKAHLAQADVIHLPFADRTFCLTLAWRMLHLNRVEPIHLALREAARVTRRDGLLYCSLRSTTNTLYRIGREEGEEIERNTFVMGPGDLEGLIYHFFEKEEIVELLKKDFNLIRLEETQLEHTDYTAGRPDLENTFWIALARRK
jgi:SAM-dependent methyltransferase